MAFRSLLFRREAPEMVFMMEIKTFAALRASCGYKINTHRRITVGQLGRTSAEAGHTLQVLTTI